MASFNSKNKNIFAKVQTDTSVHTTTFANTDVIACLNDVSYSTNQTTDQDEYVGSDLERDLIVTVTDKTAELKAIVLAPQIGILAGAPVANDVAFTALWNSANATVTLSGTGATAKAVISNGTSPTNNNIYFGYVKTTSNYATDKQYFSDQAIATCDLSIENGKKAKFTFNLKGNFYAPTQVTEYNVQLSDYGKQKTGYAANVRKATLAVAELYAYGGSASNTTNICFYKMQGTNIFGQQHDRDLSGCSEEYVISSTQGDLTITVREDAANVGIEWNAAVMNFYGMKFVWGVITNTVGPVFSQGTQVALLIDKMQLIDVKQGSVNNRETFDLVFKIVGTTKIVLDSSTSITTQT